MRERARRIVLQQVQPHLFAAHLREKALMAAALQHAVHVVEQLEGFAEALVDRLDAAPA